MNKEETFIDRINREIIELDEKRDKLFHFIETNVIINEMDSIDRNLLLSQLSVMSAYSTILKMRLERLSS